MLVNFKHLLHNRTSDENQRLEVGFKNLCHFSNIFKRKFAIFLFEL